MAGEWMFIVFLWTIATATNIRLLECDPPDIPIGGDYGPKQPGYLPGDSIHYFCEADTFIGGNYYRRCEDTGDWSGDTPVCDSPSAFSSHNQTSTADYQSESESAVDGLKDTCSATKGEIGDQWLGTFLEPGQLIRVMLFLPTGPASYEVILIKKNGQEVICGSKSGQIDRYEWTFHNCPEPHNTGAAGLKIRSLTSDPLRICELQAYVLTSPKCTDPRMRIESGYLSISRNKAVLTCEKNYLSSRDIQLDCIREGVWNRKNLYCAEPNWEENNSGNQEEKKPDNPDRERET